LQLRLAAEGLQGSADPEKNLLRQILGLEVANQASEVKADARAKFIVNFLEIPPGFIHKPAS
jgi:hypothetical protein